MIINNTGYELKTATASDVQGDLTSYKNTVNHSRNGILDQTLLRFRIIKEVTVLTPPSNLRISVIGITQHTAMTPAVKEILAGMTLSNTWTNRILRQITRTGVDKYIPIYTPIQNGISETYIPDSSDSEGTRIDIGTSGTSPSPPAEAICSPGFGNKRQSTTPDFINSDKLDASIDVKFTNNFVAPLISPDVVSDKLSNSSSQDLYARVGMHNAVDPINYVTPQFMYLGFFTVDTLYIGAGLWTPANRVVRHTDFAHWRAPDHIFGETTVVGDAVSAKSDYNYKTDFERRIRNLSTKIMQGFEQLWT